MIGKILGAIAGKSVSQHVNGVGGTGGALLGVGAATVLRRMGPLGLIAVAAGGYALKKHLASREQGATAAGTRP
ncbi:hypothetical protein [Novosphingobium lindaniclasticum]|uniref:Uncharacterized protein n=1 Tax=Novosphingobium lindaniclasticum LE124 TaxID=1096930 RepID=T0H9E3_9SPHN|nr:hypothetical protein [Novosphingobium lindaniclasticum]EQB12931.1 hypothetical protein L284_14845 [Novosphingobium lindaniclasticum LE124]